MAGNVAFQAAGVAEVPFRGFRLCSRRPVPADAGKMPALPGSLG